MALELPDEIWVSVFDYLEPKSVANLSLTSFRWHKLSRAHLYRELHWHWGSIPRYRIAQHMITLFRYPHLLKYVQEVEIYSKESRLGANHSHVISWPKEQLDYKLLKRALLDTVKGTGVPDQRAWQEAIENKDPYAYVALLLPNPPNLRSLKLDYSFVAMGGWPGLMLTHLTSSQIVDSRFEGAFNRLEVLDYGSNVPDLIYDHFKRDLNLLPDPRPEEFLGLFRLKGLKHLGVWLRWSNVMFEASPGTHWNLAQLQTLVLVRSRMGEAAVPKILQLTKSLRSLHLGLVYRNDDLVFDNPVQYVRDGLMMLIGQLEHLSIDFHYPSRFDGDYGTADEWQKRFDHLHAFLKSFTKLKTLELPIEMLLGFKDLSQQNMSGLLPKSLEKLALRDDLMALVPESFDSTEFGEWKENSMFECVQRFLKLPDQALQVPHLKQIVIRLGKGYGPLLFQHFEIELLSCTELTKDYGILVQGRAGHMTPGYWTNHALRDIDEEAGDYDKNGWDEFYCVGSSTHTPRWFDLFGCS
ncbi:hypothetical protein BO94DRAFT_619740 [Aspergillus sclerotioniger CBS 115572]|uniref:F-box domain-containing protein n=1 Tax=Aspergillus sclerotioniger CBS 115572 TaxID=1450535 RepID=A0A317XGX6_9EURO|nr:hypothetical protein BO94DRAFT_619740 [Aspergillus sclerotioniger CBS 115572]PWY96648.1 hypothetical protein BO94DRAFT_619740 [Aspergillus sclerotioniger CBS 115572]